MTWQAIVEELRRRGGIKAAFLFRPHGLVWASGIHQEPLRELIHTFSLFAQQLDETSARDAVEFELRFAHGSLLLQRTGPFVLGVLCDPSREEQSLGALRAGAEKLQGLLTYERHMRHLQRPAPRSPRRPTPPPTRSFGHLLLALIRDLLGEGHLRLFLQLLQRENIAVARLTVAQASSFLVLLEEHCPPALWGRFSMEYQKLHRGQARGL